jgi:hypothetical protein
MPRFKLTVIACACYYWVCGGSLAPAADYVQDFREPLNGDLFRLNGARAQQYSKRTPDGLLLAIPGERQGTGSVQVGVLLRPKVVGDFEATAYFEFPKLPKPDDENDVGLILWARTLNPKSKVSVGRFERQKAGGGFSVVHTLPDGNLSPRRYFPAAERAGGLRLIRTGKTVRFLAADGTGEFKELHSIDVGAADIDEIALVTDTAASKLPLDVLFKSLTVRTNRPADAEADVAKATPTQNAGAKPKPDDVMARTVSLVATAMPLREALASVARFAGVELQLDAAALKQAGLDVDQPVTATIRDEPLTDALVELIKPHKYVGVFRMLRGGKLVVTTLRAYQADVERRLPDWLRPHFNHGLVASLDDDGNVVSISAGEAMTDDLLGKLTTLPKLRELHVETTKSLTPAGLDHLARLSALEDLSVFSLKHDGKGLGDEIVRRIAGLKSIRHLRLSECGTTDAGVRILETMPQLTHLDVYQEGLLTDAAMASIAKLKRLTYLGLNTYVGTEYGWMRFSKDATRALAALTELEELHIVGQGVAPETLQFPRLRSLSLGGPTVDDACAARVAACGQLQSLSLVYTGITDDGLSRIGHLPELSRLNLDSLAVTDAGISHLTTLPIKHISLRASRLTDETLRHLSTIKTLARVDLNGSGQPGSNPGRCFTIAGVQQLKTLPKLRTLWLTNFAIGGGYVGLKELTQLRELVLTMSDIRNEELDALEAALPNSRISGGSSKRLRKSEGG